MNLEQSTVALPVAVAAPTLPNLFALEQDTELLQNVMSTDRGYELVDDIFGKFAESMRLLDPKWTLRIYRDLSVGRTFPRLGLLFIDSTLTVHYATQQLVQELWNLSKADELGRAETMSGKERISMKKKLSGRASRS